MATIGRDFIMPPMNRAHTPNDIMKDTTKSTGYINKMMYFQDLDMQKTLQYGMNSYSHGPFISTARPAVSVAHNSIGSYFLQSL